MRHEKLLSVSILILAGVLLVSGALVWRERKAVGVFGSARQNVTARDIFGTQASKITLTGNFTTSTAITTKGYDKLVIAGAYTPGAANSYVILSVEASIDDGATYFPLSARSAAATEVSVFADSGTNMSATSGIPFIFPGDKTSVSGTTVTSTIVELENVAYTHIRVSPKESVSANNGTLWMQVGGKIDF